MTERKETPNLPVLAGVADSNIPTKKLSVTQLKNYRGHADKVVKKISDMLCEVRDNVLEKFRKDNRDKIITKLITKFNVMPLHNKITRIKEKAEKANQESKALVMRYQRKIAKLESERDTAISKYKEETLMPIIDEFDEFYAEVTKKDGLKNPYDGNMKIKQNKEYDRDYEFDSEDMPKIKRELDIEYPALNTKEIFQYSTTDPAFFIGNNDIDIELDEIMAPAKKEFEVAALKLNKMAESVDEVMMFDEERMNAAFNKLFEFRNSIEGKYLEIVKGVDPETLNRNGENND